LDIGAVAPNGAPIWRVAISEPHSGSPTADPNVLRATNPDTASFDLNNPDELGLFTGTNLNYDRFIWFSGARSTTGPVDAAATSFSSDFTTAANIGTIITNNSFADLTDANSVFYASNGINGTEQRLLAPGQYLVLAPRTLTYLGSRSDGSGNPLYPSRQRFQRVSGAIAHARNDDGSTNPPTETRTSPAFGGGSYHTSPLTLVVGSFLPAGWNASSFQNGVVGLSVSEPLHSSYYTSIPAKRYNGTAAADQQDNDGFAGADYPLLDAYLDLNDTSSPTALDVPLDPGVGIIPASGDEPVLGTQDSFCSAFLQRLADPTQAYNPVTNPYRTVDWMQIDLTVFTGEGSPVADLEQGSANYAHRSRQKDGNGANSLFSYSTNDSEFAGGGTTGVGEASSTELDFFHFNTEERFLYSSLGFLNTPTYELSQYTIVQNEVDTGAATAPRVLGQLQDDLLKRGHSNIGFVGFENSIGSNDVTNDLFMGTSNTGTVNPGTAGNDRNLPRTPFARHPWLNRPFASHLELMLVPGCSQGRLFEEFTFNATTDPAIYPDGTIDAAVFNAPYRHLLNFFHSSSTNGNSLELARIFDFVHTLPRFRGEVNLINPTRLTSINAAEEARLAIMRTLLPPPFAFTYDNRRQGTVNLNTLSEFPVWTGLMQGHLNAAEFTSEAGAVGTADQLSFNNFLLSRRGYPNSATSNRVTGTGPFNYDPANLDEDYPTEFAGVFKSSIASPIAMAVRSGADTTLSRRRPVNGTLLRGSGDLAQNDSGATPIAASLFVRASSASTDVTAQAPAPASNLEHDRLRNPFMRYQTLMRMPNLVSDNSQVFLLRFTLGFFEVDAQSQNLGREYKANVGENQRYKATYVIDRSIPVGFIPGQDLNARDVVIFESYDQ
jgi:hypothetical protein